MREEGIDLSNARPRKLTAELPRKPPIAQHRLRQTDRDLVTFETGYADEANRRDTIRDS
jgi:hypothetical protein